LRLVARLGEESGESVHRIFSELLP
jgi:hypothetical protein